MAPTKATTAVTTKRTSTPLAKLERMAAASCPRTAGGALAIALAASPWRMAETTREDCEASAGTEARARVMWLRNALAKIDPKAAMLMAKPICLNVELTPEAIPDRCGVTTPIAVEASGGLTRPAPTPATMKPGSRWVHVLVPLRPDIKSRPIPTSKRPGAMR